MPIITDQELQGYIEKTDKLKIISIDHEHLQESFNKTIKQRNILLVLACLFFIGLVAIFLLKSLKPELFINGYKLEKRGLTLIKTDEYTALKDIENQSKLLKETTEESDSYTDDEITEKSIADTTVYAVQIAALKDNNIQLYSDSFTQFSEFEQDGFYKYSIGAFETLEEAQDFRKKIINLGFQDAFVASFVNGERQAIEEAY